MKPQESNAVAPSEPSNDSDNSGNFFMPSNPDNEREVDLKLTMQIVTEDVDDLLPVGDTKLIASYYAIFKHCKNGVSNLAPVTEVYTKNLSKNGYVFAPTIQSVDFQKYVGNTIRSAFTIEKKVKKVQDIVPLMLECNTPMHALDPLNKKQFLLILLSELKDDTDKK
jgi:hypothetical protein